MKKADVKIELHAVYHDVLTHEYHVTNCYFCAEIG